MDPVASYAQLIQAIVDFTGMSRPMLHMHAGMAIYLIAQLMLGTRRGSLLALSVVLEIELFNEVMNRLHYGSWRWADTCADISLTLFWPTLSYAVSQMRCRRWRGQDQTNALMTSTRRTSSAKALRLRSPETL